MFSAAGLERKAPTNHFLLNSPNIVGKIQSVWGRHNLEPALTIFIDSRMVKA